MNSLLMLQDMVHNYHWTLNAYRHPCTVHNHGDKYDDDNDDGGGAVVLVLVVVVIKNTTFTIQKQHTILLYHKWLH